MTTNIVRIDSDGTPFWEQYSGTHIAYSFDWTDRLIALGGSGVSVIRIELSSNTEVVTYGSAVIQNNIHGFFVSPSVGNVGEKADFSSKVFLSDGQVDKAIIRVKVVD